MGAIAGISIGSVIIMLVLVIMYSRSSAEKEEQDTESPPGDTENTPGDTENHPEDTIAVAAAGIVAVAGTAKVAVAADAAGVEDLGLDGCWWCIC